MATTTLPLTKEIYETGDSWESYLEKMGDYREISRRLYDGATIPAELRSQFAELVQRHGGEISISAMTEEWCGDSAVTLPFVARLAEAVPGIALRILFGKNQPELKAAYEEDGFESIPMLSFFDAGWSEIGRWMERPKPANAKVEAWVAERPRIGELYGKEDPESQSELKKIFAGLVSEMEGWYRDELWRDTLLEIQEALSTD